MINHYKKICFNCHQLTCSYFAFTSAVTPILLKEHFKPTSMHSHCALCTVTVQEKLFGINLEVKGVVRWD
jgi:hypothetical protein